MSDATLASRGRSTWLRVPIKLGQILRYGLARLLQGRRSVPADELDDRLKRDIGVDPTLPRDRRTAHYSKMMEPGQPLS